MNRHATAGVQFIPTAPRHARYQIGGQPTNQSGATTALLIAGKSRSEARGILDAAKREAETQFFADLVPATIKYVGGPRGLQWSIHDTDGSRHRFGTDEMVRLLMLVGSTQREAIHKLDEIRRHAN